MAHLQHLSPSFVGVMLFAVFLSAESVPPCGCAAEEMNEAQAIGEIKRLGGTFSPRPLTAEEYLKRRRGGRRRASDNTEPRPIAQVEMAGERFGDEQLKLLKYVPTLENVYLSNTLVTDNGLKELRALPQLKVLTVYALTGSPTITDAGVKELGQITSLAELYLSDVSLSEEGFASLAALQNLQTLRVHNQDATDAAITHIAELPNLKSLSLGGPNISDDGMMALTRLATLERLDIARAGLTDRGLELVRRLPRLTSFYIDGDKLSEQAIGRLKGMTALKSFSIGGASINDASLPDLAGLPNLESLSLAHNSRITDAGLKYFAPLKKLESLELHRTGITDVGLHWLTVLPALSALNVSGTAVTDAGLEELKGIKRLREVVVPDGVTKAAIERFRKETRVNVPGR